MSIDIFPPPIHASDTRWNSHYPAPLARAAEFHFTPRKVALLATEWLLAEHPHGHTIDLGAGTGKYLMHAALAYPLARFSGIERRSKLVIESHRWIEAFKLQNCRIRMGSIEDMSLADYSGAFTFNPFYELLDTSDSALLGALAPFGKTAYNTACEALRHKLEACPPGFKIATYFCHGPEIPKSYKLSWEAEEGKLQGWIAT